MNRKITNEEILRLYYDERRTKASIARMAGISNTRIKQIVQKDDRQRTRRAQQAVNNLAFAISLHEAKWSLAIKNLGLAIALYEAKWDKQTEACPYGEDQVFSYDTALPASAPVAPPAEAAPGC